MLDPRFEAFGRDPASMLEMMMALQAMGGPHARYENLDRLRDTEAADVEMYIKLLQDWVPSEPGFALDLGSGCGYIAGEYARKWPHLTAIASEVTVPLEVDGQQFWSMPLLRKTLARLASDHGQKATKAVHSTEAAQESASEELYKSMLSRIVEVDILKPRWQAVEHYSGQFRLVTCSTVMQMKGFETPYMWRMVMAGAAKLLALGGILFMFDTGKCDEFQNRTVVERLGEKLGFTFVVHKKADSFEDFSVAEELFAVILRKTALIRSAELSSGDAVEICGLAKRADLNGTTAVLGEFLSEKGRWECRVAAGVTAHRHTEVVLIQPHNLKSLMAA